MRLAGAVGLIGLLSGSIAAHAVSITNRDDQDHKLTIVEGDTKTEHVLKPMQVLSGICAKGCTVHLDDDEEEEDEEFEDEGSTTCTATPKLSDFGITVGVTDMAPGQSFSVAGTLIAPEPSSVVLLLAGGLLFLLYKRSGFAI